MWRNWNPCIIGGNSVPAIENSMEVTQKIKNGITI